MRKLLAVLICLFCGSAVSLNAQIAGLQEREAEWKSYTLPQTNFTRQVTPTKTLVFRVPDGWKQQGMELVFIGPHEARLSVTSQTVPDGYPLTEYVAAILKGMGDMRGSSDDILTRRTQFQDLEAREVFVETEHDDGNTYRSTTWITISGPVALTVNLLVKVQHAAQFEPFFKATVQSVMFVAANFSDFETLRSAAIKTPAAGPINEVENIVAILTQLDADRESAINRLTPLFVSQPDTVADLLVDRRAAVRAAAAEALARSKNAALKPLLWHVLDDPDPFVAEAAARRLGPENDIIAQLLDQPPSKNPSETVARLWPFMSKDNRVRYMQGVFSQNAGNPKIQMGALLLLSTLTPDDFKFPLARVLAANHDPLTIVALQVANYRCDLLSVDSLMKLGASSNKQIRKLAIESLGRSGGIGHISTIETLRSKRDASATATEKEAAERKEADEAIEVALKSIRFRHSLSTAKNPEQRRELIHSAYSDPSLANFAWGYECEASINGCSTTSPKPVPPEFKINPFAENLFPQRVVHYTAIPNPGQAVQRLHATLHGLQLDSARTQASLLLVMRSLREKLGHQLGAPSDAPALIDYTGIKPDSPIVLGGWTAPGAPDNVLSAQRRAIVMRVKDRERFERIVENYQQATGQFIHLADYLGMGTRAAAALPALLPLTAQAVLSADPDKPDAVPTLSFSLAGQTELNGIPIRTISHHWIEADATIVGSVTYVAFIGDVAVMTADLATMRDLLSNTTVAPEKLLAGNEEFRRAAGSEGDVVYFSDLKALFATAADKSLGETKKVKESGALKFSTASWENAHRLVFDESDWAKPLLTFQPKELTAPRDLLPSSTLAYLLVKLDVAAAGQTWPKALHLREHRMEIDASYWSLDLQQEVLPELGPECGAVLLELSGFKDIENGTWAAFCKLKSNKLAEAFAAGKLFRNIGPTTGAAEIKNGADSLFVGIKNGFLVVSNTQKGVSALDGKTNLAATRDYSRAAEKAPAGIVAFGGYNLEATIAAASAAANDGLRAQVAGMIFSVASAFHSQSFFATANAGTIEGRSSVAMDREGRYAVADFAYLPRGANITYATLQPRGVPITNQKRLSDLVLKVRAKAPGPIDSIRDDIKSATQRVEQKSPNELVVTVAARRITPEKKIELPVTNPEMAAFLKSTGEITSDDKNVIDQARQIAGDDRDAWSVARKLAAWTHQNLQWKSVARAGAAETLATREADCSEFSQLYVSMARSLGLPARIVSGLAYSGNSFGGHAWVEVWVGEWVELDPTWGTDFVDATHIRNQASSLVTAAALNLIDLEIVETRRTVAEFQKSPKALAEHLVKAFAAADTSEVEATLDPTVLTDEFMGRGAWNGLDERERDLMSSAYRRALNEMIGTLGNDGELANNIHLLQVEEKGDRSEATCYASDEDVLLKLRLVRRDEVWYLVDVVLTDTGHALVNEKFGPVVKSIEARRAGKRASPRAVSDLVKVLTLSDADTESAIVEADRLLQTKPGDHSLRFAKAVALVNGEKNEDATKLLTELVNEQPAHAQAIYLLAGLVYESKPEEAIELYKRYSSLEPHDPRGYRDVARVYENMRLEVLAEPAYRKAIAVDPQEIPGYIDLITFLIRNRRVGEVGPLFAASDKYVTPDDDVLASVLNDLEEDITIEDAERLVAAEAPRFKASVWANLSFAEVYIREKRFTTALEVLKRAAQMDPKLAYTHLTMSTVYQKMSRLKDALKSADHAHSLNPESSNTHYRRACVLALLGRKATAMAALEKSIEIDPEIVKFLAHDEDLAALRSLPAFKKLLREAEKQTAQPGPK